MKRILLLAQKNSIYTKKITEYLSKYYEVDCLDISTEVIVPEIFKNISLLNKIYRYNAFKKIIRQKYADYHYCHIHFCAPIYGYFAKYLKKHFQKTLASLWGSDLYRINKKIWLQKRIWKHVDAIHIPHENMKKDFVAKFGNFYNQKIHVFPFGANNLEIIKNTSKIECCKIIKNKISDSIVLTIGYNGIPEQQHIKILEDIKSIVVKYNIILLLPLTYGGDKKYIEKIYNYVNTNNIRNIIITEYLNEKELACIRLITDIFINAQRTDALSASVLEYLAAGAIVLNGSWLPYKSLKDKSIFTVEFNEIKDKLEEVLNNFLLYKEKSKYNEDKIFNNYTWTNVIEYWVDFIEKS